MKPSRAARAGTLAAAAACAWGAPALAAPPPDAGGATAFVRVLGRVSTEVTRAWTERHEGEETLLATGTAFAVSPGGLLLTSRHVVEGLELVRERMGERVEVTHEVTRIEVLLPPGPGDSGVFAARVLAEDVENDLALLGVPAVDLEWLPLGDTGALSAGDALRVLGFPRGAAVEVARREVTRPGISESRGRVTALRRDDAGRVRYVQLDAALNPGNSGGPVLDEQGYVAGVVRMRLRDSNGLGFAVATEPIKDLIASHAAYPVVRERLAPGPRQTLDDKRLSLELPVGLADAAPERVRVLVSSSAGVRLEIDRVVSDRPPEALADALLGGALDGVVASAVGARRRGEGRVGGAAAAEDGERAIGLEYAVLSLGGEALLARWVGGPDAVAFNRGALRSSLESLEAEPLRDPAARLEAELEEARLRSGPEPPPQIVRGWLDEPARDAPCAGLPAPDAGRAARWPGDFRVVLRLLWWRGAPAPAVDAARSCSSRPSGLGAGSWARTEERLGRPLAREGLFLDRGAGLLLLEVQTPAELAETVRPVAAAWIRAHLPRR